MKKCLSIHTQSIHHGSIFHCHPHTIHLSWWHIKVFPNIFHLFWASIIGILSPMEITATQSKPYDIANPMVDLAYNTLIIAMCLLGELSNLKGVSFSEKMAWILET
jgi:hypothetical protein